jgi:sugar lactone lactonase YvrE
MRARICVLALALLLAAGPAAGLEPGDLVIGVGSSIVGVDPQTGAQEVLSEGPALAAVTDIAARSDGILFFVQTTAVTGLAEVGRLDPRSGERSPFGPSAPSIGGLALDRLGRLVVAVADTSLDPGVQPVVLWLDSETGEELAAVSLPGNVLGIGDVAVDREGRALLTTARSGILRVDPETGGVDWVGARTPPGFGVAADTIAVEADGSILVMLQCLIAVFVPGPLDLVRPDADGDLPWTPLPPVGPTARCSSNLRRFDPESAVPEPVASVAGQSVGMAVEAGGGIVLALVPGLGQSSPAEVVRVDPEDGSQEQVVGDLPMLGAIDVVPYPGARIEVRPSHVHAGPFGSRRSLSVVLSGSGDLDVRDVDPDSLGFGPDAAAPRLTRILRRGPRGLPDLLLLFRAGDAGFRPGDTRACLEGWTDARAFWGCDAIRVSGFARRPPPGAGDLVLAAGASLLRVDAATGDVELLHPEPGAEPLPAGVITGIAVAPGGSEIFFTLQSFVSSLGSVWRFDPRTGARSLVAGDLPGFSLPAGVVLEADGRLLVADGNELLRVDPSDGAVEVAAALGLPLGMRPSGLALEADGSALIAGRGLAGSPSAVLRVDPETGAVTPLAGNLPPLSGIAVGADGSVWVTAQTLALSFLPSFDFPPAFPPPLEASDLPGNSVIGIDPASGARSVLSEAGLLREPNGLAVAAGGSLAVIDGGGSFAGDAVLGVDPGDGAQALLTGIPALSDASAVAAVPPEPERRRGSLRLR